jgi:AcrR family transcriptional regulator
MTQMTREIQGDSADRLVDAGLELALDRGLGALTARALAERTGLSPSALNYHLGGREVLVGRVLERALTASQDWAARRLEEIGDEAGFPAWASPANILAAAIGERVNGFRPWALLLAEFESEAETSPQLRDGVGSQVAGTVEFWRSAAMGLGQTPSSAAVWSDLALGLTQLFLGEEPTVAKAPWIFDAAARAEIRMRRDPIVPLAERGVGAAERLSAEAHASEGARRLLNAALRVIAEKGAERLTQREVAASAGLSLAATTYFFRTKAELIAAAFHELHRQVSAQALATNDLQEGLAGAILEDGGESPAWRVRAMEALQLASARDPSLAPTARELRATRGATSLRWLRSLGLDVDRLDAFVVSTTMSGVVQRTRFATPGQRRIALAEGQKRVLAELFGL